jgi:hypothetical protein
MDHCLEAAGFAQARAPQFPMITATDKPIATMTADETATPCTRNAPASAST